MKRKSIIAFKVLDGLRSCNGGDLQWTMGKWHHVKGPLEMCSNGLHLTLEPRCWKGNTVYFAEGRGIGGWSGDKVVCRSARLLAQVTPQVLDEYQAKRKPIDDEYKAKWIYVADEFVAKWKTITDEYWAEWKAINNERRDAVLKLIRQLYNKTKKVKSGNEKNPLV